MLDWQTIGKAALVGMVAATAIDVQAFKKFRSFDDAAKYSWKLALWRAFHGTVIGAIGAVSVFGAWH